MFNASTWNRCQEHGPADELREFILELPESFNDKKVSLCIEETGTNPCFDLDTFVFSRRSLTARHERLVEHIRFTR